MLCLVDDHAQPDYARLRRPQDIQSRGERADEKFLGDMVSSDSSTAWQPQETAYVHGSGGS